MNENVVAQQALRFYAVEAKRSIELVLDALGWPADEALSCALDRLNELKEHAS